MKKNKIMEYTRDSYNTFFKRILPWTVQMQFSVCFAFALLPACNNKLQSISHVRVFSSHPVNWNGTDVVYEVDSVDIYYYNDLVMYKMPILNLGTSISSPSNLASDSSVTYSYFVHKLDDKNGINYVPEVSDGKESFNVDSLILRDTKLSFDSLHLKLKNLYKFFAINSDTVEKYIPVVKKNNSFSDTNFYFFTEDYNDLKFSLSPSLDKEKKKKLYKFVALFKGDSSSKAPQLRHDRERSFWFTRPTDIDTKFFISLFNQFKQDKKYLQE